MIYRLAKDFASIRIKIALFREPDGFCDSVAKIFQKLRSLQVRFTDSFFFRGIKTNNPEWARWAHFAPAVSQLGHRISFILLTGAAEYTMK